MKIAFVTDGGHHMGMGHVHQSLSLARLLGEEADVRFLTKSDEAVVQTIARAGYPVESFADDDAIFASLQGDEPDVVLFDKIDVSVELAKRIRASLRSRLVIFTNLTAANDHAHLVVLQRAPDLNLDVQRRFENISYRDKVTGALHFYGPAYWILRPEFHAYRQLGKRPSGAIRRVVLAFGGSDPSNLTALVMDELLCASEQYRIDVIVGSHYRKGDSLQRLLAARPDRAQLVNVHVNVSNVGDLLYEADLAITAAGMSMFEALCVGTPVIVIPQDDLQRDTYRGVMSFVEAAEISELPERIRRREFTDPRADVILNMRVGQGFVELAECILGRGMPGRPAGMLASGASRA